MNPWRLRVSRVWDQENSRRWAWKNKRKRKQKSKKWGKTVISVPWMNCGAHFCFTKKCLFKTRTRSVTAVMQPRSAGEFCLLLFTTDFLRLPLSLSLSLSVFFFSLSLFWSGVRPQEVNQIEAPRKNSPQKEKLLRFSRDLRGCTGERRTWVSLQSCSESLCETLACLIVKEGGGRVKSFMWVRRLDAQFGTVLIPQSSAGGCLIS